MSKRTVAPLDPVTFSILSSSFVSLVDEMVSRLQQSCMSFVIYVGDVSGGLLDAKGQLIAQGSRDVAVHVGALQPSTQAVIEDFGIDGLHPGDVFIFNDPYRGGTHLPDVTLISPIFWGNDLVAFTATKGHWSDVGGPVPGSMNIMAADIHGEGLLIPPLKLVDAGQLRMDVRNLILSNMRLPIQVEADMVAHIEAAKTGERRLVALIEKYGIDTVLKAFSEELDRTEQELAQEILKCPEGSWETEDFIDYDPTAPEAGPVRVSLRMTIQHSPPRIVYDMTGSGPPVRSGMNGTRSSTSGALVAGTKYIIPQPPMNAGWLRLIQVILPDNSVVAAAYPYACCGEVSGAYEKAIACVIRLWAEVRPHRSFAGNFNLEYVMAGGVDDRPGREGNYYVYYHWHTGGWGGKYGSDGRDCGDAIFGLGILNQSVEVMERMWPVTFEAISPVRDSAGPGRWRGGVGLESVLRIENEGGARVSYTADRGRKGPGGPRGLFGGKDGVPIRIMRNVGTPGEQELDVYFADLQFGQGDTLYHVSSGGGGYGDPLDRDPEAVAADVLDGFVSLERAREDYGVVLHAPDAKAGGDDIDWVATDRLRWTMKAATATRTKGDGGP
jgi:N-methylhydantoinase B